MHQGALLLHPSAPSNAFSSPGTCATLPHCIVVIIQHTRGGFSSKVQQSSLGINNVWGDLSDLSLLLQLSLTLRMVAEKWPHKKAIKEHKGSEFRAQCDISRKLDICVQGARPTFDMFTRVQ